jgi:two-component system response regulator AtoC
MWRFLIGRNIRSSVLAFGMSDEYSSQEGPVEHGTRSTGLDDSPFMAPSLTAPHRADTGAHTNDRAVAGIRAAGDGGAAASSASPGEHGLVVADPEMERIYRLLARLARSELPLVVHGEAGTGKTCAARAVHGWSARAAGPLVMFDCAAQSEAMTERELFGCERGALAASSSRKPGLIERAHGGTLVLEQVHQLSAPTQARLLQLIERRRMLRLGGKHERTVDVRIIATTSCDLAAAVAAGRFRRDLYDRLSATSVTMPPLRARRPEIAALAQHFLALARRHDAGAAVVIGPAALAQLAAHRWPGNVRELEHTMAYAAALVDGPRVEPWHLPEAVVRASAPNADAGDTAEALDPGDGSAADAADLARPTESFRPIAEELQALERRRMTEALRATGGVQRRAAELIGMPVRTFTFKLTQYGLRDGAPPPAPASTGRITRRRSRGTGAPVDPDDTGGEGGPDRN